MKQLLKCVLKENKWNILSASLILGMYTIFRLFPGAIMERFINQLSSNSGNSRSLVFLAEFYMISALLLYILEIGKNYCSRKAAWRMTDVLRVSLLANIIKKGQHFYNRYGTGEMIEHLGGDISVLESFVSTTMVPVLIDILSLLSILIIFFYTNVILGFCFTLFCVMVFTLLFFVQKMDSNSVIEEREARTNLTAFFAEVITLRKEIKLMCKTKNIFDRINTMMAALKQQQIRKQKYLYRIWITSLFTFALANIFSLLVGGSLFLSGAIELGTIYLVYSYSNLLKAPMEQMQYHLQNLAAAKSSYARLRKMYEYDDLIMEGVFSVGDEAGTIRVVDVSHRFDDNVALESVSFELNANEKLGIFGRSGSGKSTLCKIICKLYPLQEGEIYLFGKSVNQISIEDLRRNVVYVTASEQVFSDTLKNNLDMCSLWKNDEVEAIIRKYSLERFFHSYEGYGIEEKLNQVVNPERLSIGERQILNMLRLFFSEKRIVIFDEAIANVDPDVEDDFFGLFDLASDQHTTIIITHNVERLAKCDKIVALERGKVAEYGTPIDLANNLNSMYSRYSKKRWEQ